MAVSDALAIIAIVVSFGCFIFEAYCSNKTNKINLENKYYEKIFDEILMYKIPKARDYIFYSSDSEKLEHTEKLQGVMVELMKRAVFFKYKNLEFYNQLCEVLREIEEYLMNSEGKMTKKEYVKFESNLDKKLEDLYSLISTNSVG